MTRSLVLPWVALLLLLGAEIGAALLHAGWVATVIAPVMVALVVLFFMRIGDETPLSRIFALSGVFWVLILIGLGGIDFVVRRDVPAPVLTRSADPG